MDDEGKKREASVCDGVMDHDKTVISKIMQRFRPIAPKPSVGESSDETKSSFLVRNKMRSKRKYVRVRDKKSGNDRIVSKKNDCYREKIIKTDLDDKEIDGDDDEDRSDIITLKLLPDKEKHQTSEYCSDLVSDIGPNTSLYGSTERPADRKVVESWLTVECVSDTCSDLGRYHIVKLGCTDQEEEERVVMRMLEVDTCPWLVSDGSNRVSWVNQAYRSMMGEAEEIKVWLVVAMDLMEEIACMVGLYGAVTCRVRVRYELPTRRKESSEEVKMTVPCDVWRIRSSVFAWRLDVASSLRLGM